MFFGSVIIQLVMNASSLAGNQLIFLYLILRDTMRVFIICPAYVQRDHAWCVPNLPVVITGQDDFFFP